MKNSCLLKILILTIAVGLISACTKSLPYKDIPNKENVTDKNLIDDMDLSKKKPGSEYLYVPSSDSSNRTSPGAADARPFWQGMEKRVKFVFTETALQVLEVDSEDRFADNTTNMKLVMSIPIDHIDYRCSEDRKGNCQNREEENTDITWKQKGKFLPKFDEVKITEVNFLPIETDIIFGQSCYTEQSSRYLKSEITADAINFQIERVFRGDPSCLYDLGTIVWSLSDLTTTMVYHYSFAKLNKLASEKYQPVSYRSYDENKFGFFTTGTKKLDVDGTQSLSGENQFLNRWNPDRKVVTYYLSKEFNKPEYQALVIATQKAFAAINNGLSQAKVDLKFNVEKSSDKAPGDIRNSMIVMVEDPSAAGPLGYGPVVTDPRTGEILNGRVVMYLGNFIQGVKYAYDDMIKQQKSEKSFLPKDKSGTQGPTLAQTASLTKQNAEVLKESKEQMQTYLSKLQKKENRVHAKTANPLAPFAGLDLATLSKGQLNELMNVKSTHTSTTDLDYLSIMSKYCNYPSELFNFNSAIKKALNSISPELKPWTGLSAADKQKIIDLVVPEIWVPILVHELGHNLGLRHNFKGSEDKDNFYSETELSQMGVNYAIKFSSVMDYAYSNLSALPTLGKYDIAAIKYAYRREVEAKDGQIVKIEKDLQDFNIKNLRAPQILELKYYGFCTDENVDVNPGCKRFDEGTTVTEIVQNLIGTYENYYDLRNFRHMNAHFRMSSDMQYAYRIESDFKYIRAAKERYEDIKATFNLTDSSKDWTEVPALKDIKNAARLSGQFFLDVIETPDLTCAIAKTDKPNEVISVRRLEDMNSSKLSCFDLEMNPGFMIVGQAGKSFNSKRKRDVNDSYASDPQEIDIRGIWIDKILAAQMLFKRKLGNSSYDTVLDSYFDISEMQDKILPRVKDMLQNTLVRDTLFETADGNTILLPKVRHSMFSIPGLDKTASLSHFIPASLNTDITKRLKIDNVAQSYQKILLEIMDRELLLDSRNADNSRAVAEGIKVFKTNKVYQLANLSDAIMIDIGSERFVATPDNGFAYDAISRLQANQLFESVKESELKAIIDLKSKETPDHPVKAPAGASENIKKIYQFTLPVLNMFAAGTQTPSERFIYLLRILPVANPPN